MPKGNLAVPPFYYYRNGDLKRIDEAMEAGCGYDAPGSFAAWVSMKSDMHAWPMTGNCYEISNIRDYEAIKGTYKGIIE